jgi:hypothetical protein
MVDANTAGTLSRKLACLQRVGVGVTADVTDVEARDRGVETRWNARVLDGASSDQAGRKSDEKADCELHCISGGRRILCDCWFKDE